MEFSKIVDEILRLLSDANLVEAPSDAPPPEKSWADTDENRGKALQKMKDHAESYLDKPPSKANAYQREVLSALRLRFRNSCLNFPGNPDLNRLEHINKMFVAWAEAYAEIVAQIDYGEKLAVRLEDIAAAGKSGTDLVAGATSDDTLALEQLRDAAAQALLTVTDAGSYKAVDTLLDGLAQARQAVEAVLEVRQERAENVLSAYALLQNPPEYPAPVLDGERAAVTTPLSIKPLPQSAVEQAEAALPLLEAAIAAKEIEAVALRRTQAIFLGEVAAVRDQASVFSGLKKMVTEQIERELAGCELLIATVPGKKEKRSLEERLHAFPAALAAAKDTIDQAAYSAVKTNSSAREYMEREFAKLQDELRALPTLGREPFLGFQVDANKRVGTAQAAIAVGTGNKAEAAYTQVKGLRTTLDIWRAALGPAVQILGARKNKVTTEIALKADPPGAADIFVAALQKIRDDVALSLAKDLDEANVTEAETLLAQFDPLALIAANDAAALLRVAAAQGSLTADYARIHGAARSPAKLELQKAYDLATGRAALKTLDRDMSKTATLMEALVARMNIIGAEPVFDPSAPGVFSDIPGPQQAMAFDLLGPTLVTGLTQAQKIALGAALVSDGPAIADLVRVGFGSDPTVLAEVVKKCGGAGLANLAKSLDGPSRDALQGLISNGGLGKKPEVLAQLIGESPKPGTSLTAQAAARQRQQDSGPRIKALVENFTGADGQEAMTTLLGGCGLENSPGALASLLHEDGFHGDGAKLRTFANAFVGESNKTHRENFTRIVGTGGIQQHPSVLGPLARKSGAAGIQSIGAAFTHPTDCANLKGLLDSGGMSGDSGTPGKEHEHPDTLAKVFGEGLEGNGLHLRSFARAFSGPTGQGRAKRMLDAFNEFPDDHLGSRQPGLGIKGLLDSKHLQGTTSEKITKLSTKFMVEMDTLAPDRQKLAIRFAPHFGKTTAQEHWKPVSGAMNGAHITQITASVLKRHQPESYDLSKTNFEQSMFPPGINVGELVDLAMAQLGPDRLAAQTVTVRVGIPPVDIDLEVGFLNGDVVNHFGPRGSVASPHPLETPTFTRDEIETIYRAAKG